MPSHGVRDAATPRAHAPVVCAVRAAAPPEDALTVAASMRAWWQVPVHVLTVVEPLGSFAADAELAGTLARVEADEAIAAGPRLRAQVASVSGREDWEAGDQWSVEVLQGPSPRVIAERAHALHARGVVMGLGRHALADRLFGSETAVRVARLCDRPLLAVPGPLLAPVRRVVVATDFSPASDEAARTALSLLDAGGTLTLVHVGTAMEHAPPAWLAWTALRDTVVPGLFAEQLRRLAAPSGVHVEWTSRAGDIVTELQDVATRANADVIAAGRHGVQALERLFLGSVTTALLRRSDRAVLVATLP